MNFRRIFYCLFFLPVFAQAQVSTSDKRIDTTGFILINKDARTLTLTDSLNNAVKTYPIACARNFGNKTASGDRKTPEGLFHLNYITISRYLEKKYGPCFMSVRTPRFFGIGIHGTNCPWSIGTRCSKGCIRMHNEDASDLVQRVRVGTPVLILPDSRIQPTKKNNKEIDVVLCLSSHDTHFKDSVINLLTKKHLSYFFVSDKPSDIYNEIDSVRTCKRFVYENVSDTVNIAHRIAFYYATVDTTINCQSWEDYSLEVFGPPLPPVQPEPVVTVPDDDEQPEFSRNAYISMVAGAAICALALIGFIFIRRRKKSSPRQ